MMDGHPNMTPAAISENRNPDYMKNDETQLVCKAIQVTELPKNREGKREKYN